MDTAIPAAEIKAKRRKTILIILATVLLLLVCLWLFRSGLKTSVKGADITIAVAETGSIENTLTASGEIIPEFEEQITSPINASLQQVFVEPGTAVKAGQPILALDKAATKVEYEKLNFQLESKRNNIRKLKLDLDKSFYDIRSNNDIKQLRINSLEASVEDAKRLYKAGGGTRESVEQAELNLKVARLEKRQLENEIRNKQQTMRVDIRESEIAAAIEESDLRELGRKLQQASITATRDAVVTWVNKNIGSSITQGEALARFADLGSFKVSGTISDTYMDQVRIGMPVIIKINDSTTRGIITNINPSVQNGILSFDVALDVRNNKLLRPNMKVDVFPIVSTLDNIIRVPNGPAFKGGVTQDIFVVQGSKAIKRTITIGGSNFDYVEIKNNLKAGEKVIITDMSGFANSKELTIKN